MTKSHPIRCRCGKLQGEVFRPQLGTRAICYCKDCQAFAHFLGSPQSILDAFGGTGVVVVRPQDVSFTSGLENLCCMSLTAHGTIRWYTACCQTPVGNTLRNFKMAHVGLVHTCLEHSGIVLNVAFGPVKMHVNKMSAKGQPGSTPVTTFAASLVRYLALIAWSGISGRYKQNPFFDSSTGRPRSEPKVLTLAEHAQLMAVV